MKGFILVFLISIIIVFYSCSENIVESTPSVDELINNTENVNATFSDIQTKVFNKSCALSGCHVSGVQPPNLSGNSYNVIVNKPSSNLKDYIEPGLPNQSYLYLKLIGSNEIVGDRMPQNSSALPKSVLDSIYVWITNGALNN